MRCYSKEEEKYYYTKQIEVYQVLIDSFLKIVESGVIERFNQKVLNIRFVKAIKEIFQDTEVSAWELKYSQMVISYHTGFPNYSQSVGKGSGWDYAEYDQSAFQIVTNSEGRIQADETIKEIENTIKRLTESKDKLTETINSIDIMQKEYNQICNMIREFNHKYDYQVRQNYRFDRVY